MSLPVIKWSKCYCEDLGTQDEQGFYDYAYCYFIYEFNEELGNKIVVRRYTDEPDKCHLFVYTDGANYPLEEAINTKVQFVTAVVNFLQK